MKNQIQENIASLQAMLDATRLLLAGNPAATPPVAPALTQPGQIALVKVHLGALRTAIAQAEQFLKLAQ